MNAPLVADAAIRGAGGAPGPRDPWLDAITRRLAGLDGTSPPGPKEAGYLALAMAAYLGDCGGAAAPPPAPLVKGGLAPWQLKRVLDHVEADLTRIVTVADLAKLCSLSPFHFARAFHQSVGQPPRAFVTGRRLERARRLLDETAAPITDIALSVGYREPSHLARVFKRLHGLSPAAYRRQRLRRDRRAAPPGEALAHGVSAAWTGG